MVRTEKLMKPIYVILKLQATQQLMLQVHYSPPKIIKILFYSHFNPRLK